MKFYILFALFLTSQTVNSQTARSIEIAASDTIFLKVLSGTFLLKIEMDVDYDMSEYSYDEGEYSEEYYQEMYEQEMAEYAESEKGNKKHKKKKANKDEEVIFIPPVEIIESGDEIEMSIQEETWVAPVSKKSKWIAFLKDNKYTFDTIVQNPVLPYDFEEALDFIEVSAMNIEQIKLLYQYSDTIGGTIVSSMELQYEGYANRMEEIYKDLYKKAQAESVLLAKTIGGTSGKVIRVYEPTSDFSSLMEASEAQMKKVMKQYESSTEMLNDKKVIVKRTFVFELK